jgi:hypothetical protein
LELARSTSVIKIHLLIMVTLATVMTTVLQYRYRTF